MAALDLLSINNLVNYIGKQGNLEELLLRPILMQKGSTKIALYGLGCPLRRASTTRLRLKRLILPTTGTSVTQALNPPHRRNIRDERLNRMWTKQKVKFLRPSVEEGRDSFFNILVIHQNRAEGRGKKNSIYESMIPEVCGHVL